jgi:MoxR-like ATPase
MTSLTFQGRGPLKQAPNGPVDSLKDPGQYVASEDLVRAVNVALELDLPLLVTGDPGTGKTQLAYRMAAELGLGEVLRFNTKSSSQANDLFYHFDNLRQFATSQMLALQQKALEPPATFIRWHALGLAILRTLPRDARVLQGLGTRHPGHERPTQSLVLIDEIDKAPRDFPNDLLNQIENREFEVPELSGEHFVADARYAPIVVITSNSEKQLPEAFLRRCVYHHIEFPKDPEALQDVLGERLKRLELPSVLVQQALELFFRIRADRGYSRSPSTSELLDWLRAIRSRKPDPGIPLKQQREVLETAYGSLFKTREDIERARAAKA